MKEINVKENSSILLDPDLTASINKIINLNPDLPIKINGRSLEFDAYTVGVIGLDDLKITIEPRNKNLNIKNIFEMAAFNDIDSFIEMPTSSYDYSNDFGITNISKIFCDSLQALINHGISGEMTEKTTKSKIVRGRIVSNSYHKKKIPIEGLESTFTSFEVDNDVNRIIKSAIIRLSGVEKNSQILSKLNLNLRYFERVALFGGDLANIKHIRESFKNPNPYYELVLEYSEIILRELKIYPGNNNINWYVFLQNSNDLFEKFVRKMLSHSINEKVMKWNKPVVFASGDCYDDKILKSYTPDILIDYKKEKESARAVLDVKNKDFTKIKLKKSEIPSSQDLYQIIFYCKQLKTNVGGLIYPAGIDTGEIKISIKDPDNLTIFLIGLPMGKDFSSISKILAERVEGMLAYS